MKATHHKTAFVAIFLLAVSVCFSQTFYVDDDGPNDPGPGDTAVSDPLEDGSAEHPFDAIQEAILLADPAEELMILLLAGTYTGDGNRYIGSVRGFVLEGQSTPEDCIIDFEDFHDRGFFLFNIPTPICISNISFRNAHTDRYGGAIGIDESTVTITNCIFEDNFSSSGGAILCANDSNVIIKDSLFRRNRSHYIGGAICNLNGGHLQMFNCTITESSSEISWIGGIYSDEDSELYLEKCEISNTAGAGVSVEHGLIEDCVIRGNRGGFGGGVWARDVTIANSLICENYANYGGGGILSPSIEYGGILRIFNCTIVNNRAEEHGGGICGDGIIVNSIIRDNDSFQGKQLCGRELLFINHSNVPAQENEILMYYPEGKVYLNDVIDCDPNFITPGHWEGNGHLGWFGDDILTVEGDYRLGAGSCCIDAGDHESVGLLLEQDLAGQVRMLDGDQDGSADIDMGCYEYTPAGMGVIQTGPGRIYFTCQPGDALQQSQTIKVYNSGDGVVDWSLSENCSWLDTDITSGSADANGVDVLLSIDAAGLDPNVYTCDISLVDAASMNSPYTLTVVMYVVPETGLWVPFHYATIQEAINAAESGQTVLLADGRYTGQGNWGVDVSYPVTLKSATGPEHCILKPDQEMGTGIIMGFGAVLDGLTMTGGDGFDVPNRALLCFEDSHIKNSIFLNNMVLYSDGTGCAGAVCRSNTVFEKCIFQGNISNEGGAVQVRSNQEQAPVQFVDCVFRQNLAITLDSTIPVGGAVHLEQTVAEFDGCLFEENLSVGNAGAMHIDQDSNVEITQSDFINNQAEENGGAVFSHPEAGSTVIEDCRFMSNIARNGYGGGLCLNSAEQTDIKVNRCLIDGNIAKGNPVEYALGGGIYFFGGFGGHLSVTDSRIIRNQSCNEERYGYGGGIYADGGLLELDRVMIEGNQPGGLSYSQYSPWIYGDPVSAADIVIQRLMITNSLIYGNRSYSFGAGLEFSGTCSIYNSIIRNNETQDIAIQESQISTVSGILSLYYTDLMGGIENIQNPGGSFLDGFIWTQGNFDIDPLFVNPGYWEDNATPDDWSDDTWVEGDYHLKSHGLRWDTTGDQWTWDDVTSRCIDAGHPGMSLGDELMPEDLDPQNLRGENIRINVGPFGGTAQASIAPTGWSLLADITNDGIVNLDDFSVLAADWLDDRELSAADFSRQDGVTIEDLTLLVNDWLHTTSWY